MCADPGAVLVFHQWFDSALLPHTGSVPLVVHDVMTLLNRKASIAT